MGRGSLCLGQSSWCVDGTHGASIISLRFGWGSYGAHIC